MFKRSRKEKIHDFINISIMPNIGMLVALAIVLTGTLIGIPAYEKYQAAITIQEHQQRVPAGSQTTDRPQRRINLVHDGPTAKVQYLFNLPFGGTVYFTPTQSPALRLYRERGINNHMNHDPAQSSAQQENAPVGGGNNIENVEELLSILRIMELERILEDQTSKVLQRRAYSIYEKINFQE